MKFPSRRCFLLRSVLTLFLFLFRIVFRLTRWLPFNRCQVQRAVSSEICAASMQDAMIVFLKVDTDSGEMTERDPPMVPSCGLASISGVCFASVMPTSLGQAFLRISSIRWDETTWEMRHAKIRCLGRFVVNTEMKNGWSEIFNLKEVTNQCSDHERFNSYQLPAV